MKAGERRLAIYDRLKNEKFIETKDLVKEYDVSFMTIRRDLIAMEKQGLVQLQYGGAMLNEGASVEPTFTLKEGSRPELKKEIAYEASKLINDGDVIAIDCGTTALMLARYLRNKRVTVITNSWKTLSYLHDFDKVEVILAPGIYDRVSQGAISSSTIDFFTKYNIDKCFMSTQGIDLAKGISVPEEMDASVKRSIMSASNNKILLCDHTKFGVSYLANFASISDFDLIVVDHEIDSHIVKEAKASGADILVASEIIK